MKIIVGTIRSTGPLGGETEHIVPLTLRGTDMDFISLIDQGDGLTGYLADICAMVAERTGLVAARVDDRAQAARLLRRAAEVLERGA